MNLAGISTAYFGSGGISTAFQFVVRFLIASTTLSESKSPTMAIRTLFGRNSDAWKSRQSCRVSFLTIAAVPRDGRPNGCFP